MFIPHSTHYVMMSAAGYLEQQFRQQNCVTNSRTTIRAPLSEIPISITVEDEITIHEQGIVNCEPYGINATNSTIDLLRFKFHDFEHHTTEPPTTTVKSSEISVDSRKLIPKTDGDKRSALLFDYKLILPVLITVLVLLVMSFVIFCFLRFKLARHATDAELQELVIVPNVDINHVTDHDECDKGMSNTSTTVTDTDRQIQAKLSDVINSRD